MQQNETASFTHLPSAEELLEVYSADRTQPQSPFYERVLVRPRISIIRIVIWVVASLVVCACGALFAWMLTHRILAVVLVAAGMPVLICLIFAKRLLIALVQIYQAIAPQSLRMRCRYEPSCSVYMIMVVKKHGFWRGFPKGLKRWRSCKPPNGGYDFP
jgi:putative membrane protein insertion efficiency factor